MDILVPLGCEPFSSDVQQGLAQVDEVDLVKVCEWQVLITGPSAELILCCPHLKIAVN